MINDQNTPKNKKKLKIKLEERKKIKGKKFTETENL